MKKDKIQNRSQKNSHSCVPLREATDTLFVPSPLTIAGQEALWKAMQLVLVTGRRFKPPSPLRADFFEGDRCLCLTLKFVERLKCYSAKPNESCIIFGIYYFISCLISIVILSLCIFLFLLSFLVRYRVKTMQEKEKNVSNCCMRPQYDLARLSTQ